MLQAVSEPIPPKVRCPSQASLSGRQTPSVTVSKGMCVARATSRTFHSTSTAYIVADLFLFFFLRDSLSLKPSNYFPLPFPAPSPILCSNFFSLSLLSAFPGAFSSLYPFRKTPFLGSFPTESEHVTGLVKDPTSEISNSSQEGEETAENHVPEEEREKEQRRV